MFRFPNAYDAKERGRSEIDVSALLVILSASVGCTTDKKFQYVSRSMKNFEFIKRAGVVGA